MKSKYKPTRKVRNAGIAGIVATVLILVAGQLGVVVDEETALWVAGSIVAVLGTAWQTTDHGTDAS